MSGTEPEIGFRQRFRRMLHFESSIQRPPPPTAASNSCLASPAGKTTPIASPQNPPNTVLPTFQSHASSPVSGPPPASQQGTIAVTQPTSAAVSVRNQPPWQRALSIAKDHLSEKERKQLDPALFECDSIESMIKAVENAQKDAKEKRWSCHDKVGRILKGLEKYAKIVDTGIQHNPEITALVWGAVRFMLQVALNRFQAVESLETAMETILTRMAACEFYASLYTESLHVTLNSERTTLAFEANLDSALPEFYASILVFSVKAKGYFALSTATAKLTTPLKPFSVVFQPYLEKIDETELAVQKLADNATMEIIKRNSKDLQRMQSFLDDIKSQMAPLKKLDEIHEGVSELLDETAIQTLRKCRVWLNGFDPSSEYEQNLRHRASGTCSWIFRNNLFREWLSFEKAPHLWIEGRPGAGKTTLSAAILERIQTLNGVKVLYFFFKDGDKSSSAEMAASLIDQVVMSKIDQKRLFDILKRGYDEDNSESCRAFNKLWKIFVDMLRGFPAKILILLDAFDECEDRHVLADALLASKEVGARFLITSRPEHDISEMFRNDPDVSTIGMDVEEDIREYVKERVAAIERLHRFKEKIISTVPGNAVGMFRYAALMFEELNHSSPKKITDILNAMPKGLNGMYELMLLRLHERHPKDTQLRRRILLWVAMAYRPVTVDEMAYACATKDGEKDFDPNEKILATTKEMLTACGSLIEIFDGDKVRFTHLTVKEFLFQPPKILHNQDEVIRTYLVQRQEGHASMALTCVTQLSVNVLNCSVDSIKSQSHYYAVVNWLLHAEEVASEDHTDPQRVPLWNAVESFFESTIAFQKWNAIFPNYESSHRGRIMCRSETDSFIKPAHISASYGFACLIKSNITAGVDFEVKDTQSRMPLWWAASRGQEVMVRLLLVRDDVNVNSKDTYGDTPLSMAAIGGHEAVVRLLLARDDIDINSKDEYNRTPLWWATREGHDAVVRLLLEQDDIDVNSKDQQGRMPLTYAAINGNEKVVRLLLAMDDINVNSKDEYDRTPLWWATREGHDAVVRLLLEQDDIDVNSKDQCGHIPLAYAAINGHEKVLRLLLARDDIDINPKDEYDRTPLWWAANKGHDAVARLLLEQDGIDVNSKNQHGHTPLTYAAANGHEKVARLLLAMDDIDVNSKDRDGDTPLSEAAEGGYEKVVRLLLARYDIDVNPKGEQDRTPLLWAAWGGHEVVVRLLLARDDVNVNSKDENGNTALSVAARKGNDAIVRLLLVRDNVDVNSKDENGNTALSVAASRGHDTVMRLLLARDDVDINSKNKDSTTALSIAVEKGHQGIVRLLADRSSI